MEIRIVAHGSPDYDAEVMLRRRILRWPLGREYSDDDLAREVDDIHVVGFIQGKAVACALLTDAEGVAKMRQVAVDESLQGQGLGRQLVEAFEREAKQRGYRDIVLNAREGAIPFYLALGYALEGEPFEEVGIPHRRMRKSLA